MVVLYIVLGILGGLLLLLFLLTLCPARALVWFDGEFRMELRYLWLRFPIAPGEPDTEEEAPEPPEEEPKKEGPGTVDKLKTSLKRQGLDGFLKTLCELIGLVCRGLGGILKRLRLKGFDLYICLPGADDPAAAAVLYGQVSTGVYSACGGLFTLMPCRKRGVSVDLDYSAAEPRIIFEAKVSILPIFVIKEALVMVIKGLGPLRRLI